MNIKDLLKTRRTELGLSQLDVAKYVGVSEATVSRWESGNIANMKRDRIYKLANILQINPSVLIGDIRPLPTNIIPMPQMNPLPLVGGIACGKPVLAVENIEETVEAPENVRADFALRCKGDSMINARIYDGDIVYIRKQPTVDNGQIAAVLIDDEATLKRVQIYNDHIVLKPENPLYKPLVFWDEEMENVHILGLAVAFTGPVK